MPAPPLHWHRQLHRLRAGCTTLHCNAYLQKKPGWLAGCAQRAKRERERERGHRQRLRRPKERAARALARAPTLLQWQPHTGAGAADCWLLPAGCCLLAAGGWRGSFLCTPSRDQKPMEWGLCWGSLCAAGAFGGAGRLAGSFGSASKLVSAGTFWSAPFNSPFSKFVGRRRRPRPRLPQLLGLRSSLLCARPTAAAACVVHDYFLAARVRALWLPKIASVRAQNNVNDSLALSLVLSLPRAFSFCPTSRIHINSSSPYVLKASLYRPQAIPFRRCWHPFVYTV